MEGRGLGIVAEFREGYGVVEIHRGLKGELQAGQGGCSARRVCRLRKELDVQAVSVDEGKAAAASCAAASTVSDIVELEALPAVGVSTSTVSPVAELNAAASSLQLA